MWGKKQIIAVSYAMAAIIALGAYGIAAGKRLEAYRTATGYSASLAFEETVGAVSRMHDNLAAAVYATDGSMCGKLCSRISADAMAAEAALSVLPFATQELEETADFLNQVGDYAYTLCSTAVQDGFREEDVRKLTELEKVAGKLVLFLRELQTQVHQGAVRLDRQEKALINVGIDESVKHISEEFVRMEREFPQRTSLRYDGKYGEKTDIAPEKARSDVELLAIAASYAGVSPGEMQVAYDYESGDGRRCFRSGDLLVCVDNQGVESFSQSRLVSETRISMEKAQKIAERYLAKQSLSPLQCVEKTQQGGMGHFTFAAVQEDVLMEDRRLRVSVALDDGSIYAFHRGSYNEEEAQLQWEISEEQARVALPEQVEEQDCQRVLIKSEGGAEAAAYCFSCKSKSGDAVQIYVDGRSGRQARIKT